MDKVIPILPEDIVKIIVGLLDPHMVTLLDKKYRDGYFKKYGLSIKDYVLSKHDLVNPLLQKYKINLYMYRGKSCHKSEILYKNVVSINHAFICDLEHFLNKYTNLIYISGRLEVSSYNLEKLGSIDNNLILYISSERQLELLKKYTDIPNLIDISYMYQTYYSTFDGLENRIRKAPSHVLKSNTEYPNIKEIKVTNHMIIYLEKNLRLPRLEKISIDYYTLNSDKVSIRKKYPGVIIKEC